MAKSTAPEKSTAELTKTKKSVKPVRLDINTQREAEIMAFGLAHAYNELGKLMLNSRAEDRQIFAEESKKVESMADLLVKRFDLQSEES